MDTIDITILFTQAERKVKAIREQAEALVPILKHMEGLLRERNRIEKGQGEGGGHHPPANPL